MVHNGDHHPNVSRLNAKCKAVSPDFYFEVRREKKHERLSIPLTAARPDRRPRWSHFPLFILQCRSLPLPSLRPPHPSTPHLALAQTQRQTRTSGEGTHWFGEDHRAPHTRREVCSVRHGSWHCRSVFSRVLTRAERHLEARSSFCENVRGAVPPFVDDTPSTPSLLQPTVSRSDASRNINHISGAWFRRKADIRVQRSAQHLHLCRFDFNRVSTRPLCHRRSPRELRCRRNGFPPR